MEKDNREEERFDESADTDSGDDALAITMKDMQSFSSIAGRDNNSARGLQNFGSLDIVEPNRHERPSREPREISEEEYQKLADEIKATGKIPERLKKAFEEINGDRVIDVQRLNDLLKDKNMKIEIRNYQESGPKLELTKNGQIIDSYPNSRRELPPDRPNGSPEPVGPPQSSPEQGRSGSPEPGGPVPGRPEQGRPPRENENGSPEPGGPVQSRPEKDRTDDLRLPENQERPREITKQEEKLMWNLREAMVGGWSDTSEKLKEAMTDLLKMPRETQDRVLAALTEKLNGAGISLWVDRASSPKEGGQDRLNLTMNIPARPGLRDSGYIQVTLSSSGEHSGEIQHSLREKPVKLDAATAQSYITEFANWQNMFGVYGPHVRPRK